MLDFNKTDLVNGSLIIRGGVDYPLIIIQEEGCNKEDQILFDEFRVKYPNGKPVPLIEPVTIMSTDRERIEALENYLLEKEMAETIK